MKNEKLGVNTTGLLDAHGAPFLLPPAERVLHIRRFPRSASYYDLNARLPEFKKFAETAKEKINDEFAELSD